MNPNDSDRQTAIAKLTPEQRRVTQEDGTEAPFRNQYWDNKEPGIYIDIVSGEALFSSTDKFDSGTGWPSFAKPIDKQNVTTRTDSKLMMTRTEVRSKQADSHLGHVFDDGPGPDGQRYCINSASLRFIPVDKLEVEGYGQYLHLFKKTPQKTKAETKKTKASSETATLAGGCFWGMEELIRKLPGVLGTVVGYTGGKTQSVSYDTITSGTTGHAESIQVTFDPDKLSYGELLDFFFRMHNPTTKNRQGNDTGTQYRSAIFYHNESQRKDAEQAKQRAQKSGRWKEPIVTEIVKAATFHKGEDYHQDYLQKHPGGYSCHYVRE